MTATILASVACRERPQGPRPKTGMSKDDKPRLRGRRACGQGWPMSYRIHKVSWKSRLWATTEIGSIRFASGPRLLGILGSKPYSSGPADGALVGCPVSGQRSGAASAWQSYRGIGSGQVKNSVRSLNHEKACSCVRCSPGTPDCFRAKAPFWEDWSPVCPLCERWTSKLQRHVCDHFRSAAASTNALRGCALPHNPRN